MTDEKPAVIALADEWWIRATEAGRRPYWRGVCKELRAAIAKDRLAGFLIDMDQSRAAYDAYKRGFQVGARSQEPSEWHREQVTAAHARGYARGRDEALAEVEERIAASMPHNHNLHPDGTEDPIASAYDLGQLDAIYIVRELRKGSES